MTYAAKAADDAAANFGGAGDEHMRREIARARAERANARPTTSIMTSIARADPGRLSWESSMKMVRRPSTTTIAQHCKLTPSELRVLHAVLEMDGGGIRAIADTLGISQATVKTHLHHIFKRPASGGRSIWSNWSPASAIRRSNSRRLGPRAEGKST